MGYLLGRDIENRRRLQMIEKTQTRGAPSARAHPDLASAPCRTSIPAHSSASRRASVPISAEQDRPFRAASTQSQ